jgi:hypothetical protein
MNGGTMIDVLSNADDIRLLTALCVVVIACAMIWTLIKHEDQLWRKSSIAEGDLLLIMFGLKCLGVFRFHVDHRKLK